MTNDPPANLSDSSSQFPATIRLRKSPDAPSTIPAGSPVGPDFPGKPTVVGDYELLAELARGGMGIVYKARQRKLNRIVALKVTRGEHLALPEDVLRLQIEATAAAKLDHPNIVPIYEVGEAAGQRFFSMAYIEGQSLGQALAAGPLPPRRAAELIKQVALAVAYAHRQGVIHRDLKPSNIMLDAGGQPRVTDFGLAKFAETESGLTLAGQVMGTPSYMSPEQAEAKMDVVGPAADVYSLGATLYCLVTGRPPFQAATPLETIKQVVEREPISPRHLNPAVDRDLDTICLKCLQKRPDRRYAPATALADDLQRFLDNRPILARPVGRPEKLVRWCRRNPLVAASILAASVIFLVAFLLISWSYYQTQQALAEVTTQRELAQRKTDEAEQREKGERWARYKNDISLAASYLQLHNVGAARRSLLDAPAEHRNWEWRHLHNQLDAARHFLSIPEQVTGAFITEDGDRVAMFHSGNTVRVWDTVTHKAVADVRHAVAGEKRLSPDGRLFGYHTKDNTVVIQDVDLNRVCSVLKGHDKFVGSFHFSCDSGLLVTGSEDHTGRVWDTPTGKQLLLLGGHQSETAILQISRDSRRVVSYEKGNHTCRVWDLASGKQIATLLGHERTVIHGRFSLRGDRFLTIEKYPSNSLRLWDTETGRLLNVMQGHTNEITAAEFSPDGTLIATSGLDQTVRLWNGVDRKPLATLKGHNGQVLGVRFSPDGKHLVSASQDQTVRLWDVASAAPLAVLHGHTAEIYGAAFSADGKSIISASRDGTVRLWDARLVASNGVLRGHTDFVYSVAFHPDGRRVASASWDGTIRLWDATTGRELATMKYDEKTFLSALAIHPSGGLIASLGRDNAVRLWDVATAKQIERLSFPGTGWPDSRLAFSPAGDLAAGNGAGDVYLWQISPTGKPAGPTVLKSPNGAIRDVAFSPNGRWLAAASDGSCVFIWDLASKEKIQTLKNHTSGVYALAFSAESNWLASGALDGTVRLWDSTTWQEVDVLKHGTSIYGLAFTPDGTRLAAGCVDNSIRFWDLAKRQQVAELRGHDAYVHCIAFSPDGSRLVSASGDFTVRVWDTLSAPERAGRNGDIPNR